MPSPSPETSPPAPPPDTRKLLGEGESKPLSQGAAQRHFNVAARPTGRERGWGEVRLWHLPLDRDATDLARLGEFLCSDERERAARFHFERDRNRFVAGRGSLRETLGGLLKIPPAAVKFAYGPHGKPALAHETDLRFNLSHSQDLALLAVTENREVGVDLEWVRPDLNPLEIAPSVFSPDECAVLESLPESERLAAFYGYWTRKEAFLKALGLGFSRDTKTFTLALAPEQALEDHAILSLDAPPGFAAAIALSQSYR